MADTGVRIRALASVALTMVLFVFGCSNASVSEPPPAPGADASSPVDGGIEADAASDSSSPDADAAGDAHPLGVARVTLLHTGDERGAVLPVQVPGDPMIRGGAANVFGWWKQVEKYDPQTHLVLSSGDSWIGPPTSTWLKGKNVVEVFNLMGYEVATLGPRDFDFGRDVLDLRISEAAYSFVSANILDQATGTQVDFAKPYVMVPIQGVNVAVIGLMRTDVDTLPSVVADLAFADHVMTIEARTLDARSKGADIVIVLSCAGVLQMTSMVSQLSVPVDLVFAGDDGTAAYETSVNGTQILLSPSSWAGYHKVVYEFDLDARQIAKQTVELVAVEYDSKNANPVVPDPGVEALVQKWEQVAALDLDTEIGFTNTGIVDRSWTALNWTMDSWLAEIPDADLAILNLEAFHAKVSVGSITFGEMVAAMPFENYIHRVTMTGAQLKSSMEAMLAFKSCTGDCLGLGGMRYKHTSGGMSVTLTNGDPLDPIGNYVVLMTDYVLQGSSGFPVDASLQAAPTGMHMRDPVVAWTKKLNSSTVDPVEDHIDSTPRAQ